MAITNKRNNINRDSSFDITNFTNQSEAIDYTANKIIGNDTLLTLSESGINTDGNIDLNKLIDTIGKQFDFTKGMNKDTIEELNKILASLLTGQMNIGSLFDKNNLLNYLFTECGMFNLDLFKKFNFKIPDLRFYAMSASLLGLICMGIENAVSEFHKLYKDSVSEQEFIGIITTVIMNANGTNAFNIFQNISSIQGINLTSGNSNFSSHMFHFLEMDNGKYKNEVEVYDTIESGMNGFVSNWSFSFLFLFLSDVMYPKHTALAKSKSLSIEEPITESLIIDTTIDNSVYKQLVWI